MKDRIPGAPGQYKAVVTSGNLQKLQNAEQFTITLTRDDQPLVEGTPYSKAAVLPDSVAADLCQGVSDPTPANAFQTIAKHLKNEKNPHGITAAQIGAYPATKPNLSNVDLNDYIGKDNVGTYWCTTGITNAPFSEFFHLEVNGSSQRATNYPTGKIKSRAYINGAWSEWKEPNDLRVDTTLKNDGFAADAAAVGKAMTDIALELVKKQNSVAGVTDKEIGYLDGVTSNIQEQIDGISLQKIGALGMELIWSNANSASSFAAQTISLDLSKFDFVLVRLRTHTGATNYVNAWIRVRAENVTNPIYSMVNLSTEAAVVICSRNVAPHAAGVVFGDVVAKNVANISAGVADNARLIPVEIYGIRGVKV